MQALTWILGGIAAGWLTGFTRKGRGYGLLGNLLIGMAGGIVGVWLFRSLGVTAPGGPVTHVLVSFVGGLVLATSVRLLDQAARRAGAFVGQPAPTVVDDVQAQVRRLGGLELQVLTQFLRRRPVAKNLNATFEQQITFGQRLADQVAAFGGSWTFIMLFGLVLVVWIWANAHGARPWDPYPFILLNLVLSCLAALQAPVIMMSQNRQAAKDRLDAQNDYEVNLKAEMEILALHSKLDEVREREGQELVELQQRHQALMDRLERLLKIHEADA
jgi:uncharacterized membrane protein/uncharacterized membrane protein YeaQ/YmgE (transglycosylase-associated protein family)